MIAQLCIGHINAPGEESPDAQTSPHRPAPTRDFHVGDSHAFVGPIGTHCLVQPLEWRRFVAGGARASTLGAFGIVAGAGNGVGYRGHHGVGGTITPALVCGGQCCHGFGACGADHRCLGAGRGAMAFPRVALGWFGAQCRRPRRQPVGAAVLAPLHPRNPAHACRMTGMGTRITPPSHP